MTLWMSILLGLVQGITEFLPVSSSGHLSILQNLLRLGYSAENNLLFDVLVHLGTLVSVCLTFRKDLRSMVADTAEFIRERRDGEHDEARLRPSVRLVVMIVVGTLPLLVAAVFMSKLALLFSQTWFIGIMLIITGALVSVSNKIAGSGGKNDRTTSLRDVFIIGLSQAVALIPGLSRSGTTIAVGLARGLRRDFAVRFSLLLSIPAVVGSFVVTLFSALREGVDFKLFPIYVVGAAISAVVGLFSIRVLRRITVSGKMKAVSYYCWAVGALAIILTLVL
ncbi:MAG: undecaprenyl-diphosphate phosphatase [Oscillospiraceae bacterium]|jgi:undecaprenyl-diphosphatase|nr:undecaprenyl-diphosphate phosphatase [Oscillospiraceae bacterium]